MFCDQFELTREGFKKTRWSNLGFWLKLGGRGAWGGSKGPTLLSGIFLLFKNYPIIIQIIQWEKKGSRKEGLWTKFLPHPGKSLNPSSHFIYSFISSFTNICSPFIWLTLLTSHSTSLYKQFWVYNLVRRSVTNFSEIFVHKHLDNLKYLKWKL